MFASRGLHTLYDALLIYRWTSCSSCRTHAASFNSLYSLKLLPHNLSSKIKQWISCLCLSASQRLSGEGLSAWLWRMTWCSTVCRGSMPLNSCSTWLWVLLLAWCSPEVLVRKPPKDCNHLIVIAYSLVRIVFLAMHCPVNSEQFGRRPSISDRPSVGICGRRPWSLSKWQLHGCDYKNDWNTSRHKRWMKCCVPSAGAANAVSSHDGRIDETVYFFRAPPKAIYAENHCRTLLAVRREPHRLGHLPSGRRWPQNGPSWSQDGFYTTTCLVLLFVVYPGQWNPTKTIIWMIFLFFRFLAFISNRNK